MSSHQTTKSTSITDFAKRAAPPETAATGAWMNVFAAIAALILVPAAYSDMVGGTSSLLQFILLALVAYSIYRLVVVKRNAPQEEARHREWERSWICARCGTKFIPEDNTPGVTAG